ncbi:Glutamyl-tRNA reductase [uncultured archaeon]|nr:Glutamyl-tRNA reductase [uncultured archaeon]
MRIAILGAGHMGSWLAKELSSGHEIAIYNRTPEKAKTVASALRNTNVLPSIAALEQFKPDMLINAVSLQNTMEAFEEAAKHISRECIIVDVASVKSGIPEYYAKSGRRFVSLHPMFGPTFANVEALEDENAVIIRESDPEGAAFFRKLFERLRLRIFDYTFSEHDQMMAYSLTVPFASTLVFAACMNSKAVPGTTFKKHMKIAKGLLSEDDHLLAEILFNPNSLVELEKVANRLEFLKHIIRGKDYEEARKFFAKLRKNIS